MARKRYGGFSDPEPEVAKEVINEPEVAKEVITEIEETTEPVTFDEEKTTEPITEPMESIEAEVSEEKEPEVTPTTPNLPYKITIAINALNIRKVLEEQDGWGRIGDNKWINLSKRFVEKD